MRGNIVIELHFATEEYVSIKLIVDTMVYVAEMVSV